MRPLRLLQARILHCFAPSHTTGEGYFSPALHVSSLAQFDDLVVLPRSLDDDEVAARVLALLARLLPRGRLTDRQDAHRRVVLSNGGQN